MSIFFFFNDTATTEIYTLSLHDALPIYGGGLSWAGVRCGSRSSLVGGILADSGYGQRSSKARAGPIRSASFTYRSEEHTSELQSQSNLVCRLLLEKKNTTTIPTRISLSR